MDIQVAFRMSCVLAYTEIMKNYPQWFGLLSSVHLPRETCACVRAGALFSLATPSPTLLLVHEEGFLIVLSK